MGEKQDVQVALDNAAASAETLKGQLAEAEARAGGLQVRAAFSCSVLGPSGVCAYFSPAPAPLF